VHQYDTAGRFTVSLVASNAYGASTMTKPEYIIVSSGAPSYLSTYGSFTISDDTSHWFFQVYADGTGPGSLIWQSNYSGQAGVLQIYQTPGQKGKLSQIFSVPSTGWYTVSTRVATDIPSTSPQQKVYLYLYQLGGDSLPDVSVNEVISQSNGGLGNAGVWRDMTVSFYAAGTMLSVQVVGINPATSGVNGSIYFDEVWVYAGAPQPITNLTIINPNFDTNTAGWMFEKYADGTGPGTWSWLANQVGHSGVLQGYQNGGEKGKASQLLNVPNVGHDALVSVWVYSGAGAVNLSQKVYLYLYSYDASYAKVIESGNVILGSGRWTPNEWRLLQFTCKPSTIYNAAQIVGINPAGRPTQSIYFDTVSVKQD
jgi:PKD repeat protein